MSEHFTRRVLISDSEGKYAAHVLLSTSFGGNLNRAGVHIRENSARRARLVITDEKLFKKLMEQYDRVTSQLRLDVLNDEDDSSVTESFPER